MKRSNTPHMQRARQMAAYYQGEGCRDYHKTGAYFNYSAKTAKNMVSLLRLSSKGQHLVESGAISITRALELVDKPHAEQDAIFDKLEAADAMRGARGDRSIAAALRGEPEQIGRDTTRMRQRDLLERWRNALRALPTRPKVDAAALISFIIGEPLSVLKGSGEDAELLLKTLAEAGLKGAAR